ncbi:MAG: NADP-dependent malic enzyme [Myxococcales bacterium]|nr:NADP-dependent malic enzyme [Myxococcales bacterium]
MKVQSKKKQALIYHREPRPGKTEIRSTKPCITSRDLSLAYTPGVAHPCLEIHDDQELAYEYTNKGNLVAVISNGTAVLGLGDIGALAGKPVMEGKAVLFKRFADIDVFDLEVDMADPEQFVEIVAAIAPTFGGINLEDIKAPECFAIERALRKRLDIPVMHDDQHGTAIIAGAGFINALTIANKAADSVQIVTCGAGAAGIACLDMLIDLGAKEENIMLVDSRGVVHSERTDLNAEKQRFARETSRRTLEDALEGADMFLGLSVGGLMSPKMLKSMADNPIVFALANPNPEIDYPTAIKTRDDVIMATGRSDYPNQVNNVLGFPFIFRGALDVRAKTINGEMKIAAARALAELAREEVTDQVRTAYDGAVIQFGSGYIIPKPFDNRVLYTVAPAVAKAATDSGVARRPITDVESYRDELKARFHPSVTVMRSIFDKMRKSPPRIVYPEGLDPRILRAAEVAADAGIARPVLLGPREDILAEAERNEVELEQAGIEIIDPSDIPNLEAMVDQFHARRNRKGLTRGSARRQLCTEMHYLGAMLVESGDCDGMVGGLNRSYPRALRPVVQTIGTQDSPSVLCAVYLVFKGADLYFFADTTVNVDPDAATLANIATTVAGFVERLELVPNIAMLSFSNFGSARMKQSQKVAEAVRLVKESAPGLNIDGEMQFNVAFNSSYRKNLYDFSSLTGNANVFIFPNLESGNIAYKMMQTIGEAEVIGPVLLGLNKPVHVLQRESDVNDIVNLTALTGFRVDE